VSCLISDAADADAADAVAAAVAVVAVLCLQLPRYEKGQHMRKVDLRLWTQVGGRALYCRLCMRCVCVWGGGVNSCGLFPVFFSAWGGGGVWLSSVLSPA
jgi:hypothetical protein